MPLTIYTGGAKGVVTERRKAEKHKGKLPAESNFRDDNDRSFCL